MEKYRKPLSDVARNARLLSGPTTCLVHGHLQISFLMVRCSVHQHIY